MMNWDDLRYFLAAARHGSSRAAARALDVNQSTISRRLAQLEGDNGVRLFDRRARGLTLTDAGRGVLEAAEEIEARLALLELQVVGQDTSLVGPIRVSLPDVMVGTLAPIIARFARKYPAIQTYFLIDNGYINLSQHEADVVVRLGVEVPDHLVGRRIAGVTAGIYGATAYLDTRPNDADLASHSWVRWDTPWRGTPPERWIDANVPASKVCAVVNTNAAYDALVAAGVGVGFQACFVGEAEPRLRTIGPPFDFGLSLWLLTHEDLRRTARVAAFMKFVGDELAAERPYFESVANRN